MFWNALEAHSSDFAFWNTTPSFCKFPYPTLILQPIVWHLNGRTYHTQTEIWPDKLILTINNLFFRILNYNLHYMITPYGKVMMLPLNGQPTEWTDRCRLMYIISCGHIKIPSYSGAKYSYTERRIIFSMTHDIASERVDLFEDVFRAPLPPKSPFWIQVLVVFFSAPFTTQINFTGNLNIHSERL